MKCLCNRCAANFGMGGDVTQSKQKIYDDQNLDGAFLWTWKRKAGAF